MQKEKKSLTDSNGNLIVSKTEEKRVTLPRENGSTVDCVTYNVKDYGRADYAENMNNNSEGFRRKQSMMPFLYIDKGMNNFNWDIYGENVGFQRKVVDSFIEQFRKYQSKGKGLYICSRVKGSGKTLLACCIANEIIKIVDTCVKFISVPELLDMTKKSFSDFKREEDMRTIKNATLLVLDDIGAQTKKEWAEEEIFKLIDYRYSNKKVTVFTSNIPKDELKIDDRIIDRINNMTIDIDIPEKPIRAMQTNKENMEFLKEVLSTDNEEQQRKEQQ